MMMFAFCNYLPARPLERLALISAYHRHSINYILVRSGIFALGTGMSYTHHHRRP